MVDAALEVATASHSRSAQFNGPWLTLMLAACIVVGQTLIMGRAVVGLNVALAVSFGLWLVRRDMPAPGRVVPIFAAALAVQIAHLLEEYRTGFHRTFPALFGYVWTDTRFVLFNVVWLTIFAASAVAIIRGHRLGYLGGFFLAIGAGIGNGLGHLALTAQAGRYFPGTYTAVLSLATGSLLLTRLLQPPRRHGVEGNRQS